MSYRSIAQILNEVFDSSDNTLKTTYKTEDEVLNLVLDESGEPALKVTLSGYIPANNIIDGEVSTYTDLPTASEHTNEIYVVDATIGIPLINRKQAGMYRSDGSAWSLLDVDLSADKVYYSGTLTSGNVQDALNEVNATLSGKALAADLTSHLSNVSNPHSVIKSQVGLGNVDNTSDANKPVSTAQQTALNAKMNTVDYIQSAGNIISPLTWLPMKKNLLTQQGQTVATYTVSTTATYPDRYGVLKTAAINTPRFNENGTLFEGASTNLMLYSEQFDNAVWTKIGASVTANTTSTTDPYGSNLSEKLIEDTSASSIHGMNETISITSGTIYTFSVFAKTAERNIISIVLPVSAFPSAGRRAYFNLSTGTVGTVETGVTASIKPYANGWYRISITATSTATASGAVLILTHITDNVGTYTGDGLSGLYVFGAQLEAMPFATSYIPTTTTPLARNYNNTYFPQAENIPYFGNDFSIVMDVNLKTALSLHQYFLSDGTTQFRLFHYLGTGQITFIFGSASVGGSASYSNTKIRVAITKTATSLTMYINGVQVSTAATGTIPAQQTNMYVGSYNGTSSHLYGSISNFQLYDRALTAQEAAIK